MCGRFTSSQRRDEIAERFQITVPGEYNERYNLAPQQRALIIRRHDDNREAALVRWGLLPRWAKDERIAYKLINARAETLADKPAFRSLLGKYRCLVVADGFYEWRLGTDGKKEALYFQLADGQPFAFAGLAGQAHPGRTDAGTASAMQQSLHLSTVGRRERRPTAHLVAVRYSIDVGMRSITYIEKPLWQSSAFQCSAPPHDVPVDAPGPFHAARSRW